MAAFVGASRMCGFADPVVLGSDSGALVVSVLWQEASAEQCFLARPAGRTAGGGWAV